MKLRVAIFIALLSSPLSAQVTFERLLRADREPQNWLTYSGGYAGHRYSSLSQINRSNVKNLQLKWSYHPLYAKNTNNQNKMENTPLVVDGVVYTGTALEAVALDAVTGRQYLETLTPARSEGVLQRLRSEQGHGHRGRHALLGHGGLPSARDRRQDRARDLGQGCSRTIARATSTTSRRSSSRTRSSWDRRRTKRAPTAGSPRTT